MNHYDCLLEKIQEITPFLTQNSAKCEQNRMVSHENIEALQSIELHKAFIPKKYGGYELFLPEFSNCITELAKACGSTAWVYGLFSANNHTLTYFSEQLQDEIWKDGTNTFTACTIAPMNTVEEVDGGIIINGEMGWSSGIDYADRVIIGCNRINSAGQKVYSLAVVPKGDYDIIDDWYAMGLKGTGSKTIRMTNVFILEYRIEAIMGLMGGKSSGACLYPESMIYSAPFRPYFSSVFAAVGLGVAEASLTAFKDKTRNRIRAYTGAHVGLSTPTLMRLAESTHQITAARLLLETSLREIKEFSARKEYPNRTTWINWRTNQAYALKMCKEAVERLMDSAGASALLENCMLQRLLRDITIITAHAYTDYDICAQILGRELMGLEPDPAIY